MPTDIFLNMLTQLQTPKRIYTLDELRLNKIEPEKLLSPQDTTIDSVRRVVQVRNSHALD